MFKSWANLFVFHFALMHLGKAWIHLFSNQFWVNRENSSFGNSSYFSTRRKSTFFFSCIFLNLTGFLWLFFYMHSTLLNMTGHFCSLKVLGGRCQNIFLWTHLQFSHTCNPNLEKIYLKYSFLVYLCSGYIYIYIYRERERESPKIILLTLILW